MNRSADALVREWASEGRAVLPHRRNFGRNQRSEVLASPAAGVELEVDRGTGWVFLAVDTVPDYMDTAPLPAAGQSALWRYRASYRLGDEHLGQWSNLAATSVVR